MVLARGVRGTNAAHTPLATFTRRVKSAVKYEIQGKLLGYYFDTHGLHVYVHIF